MANVLHCEFYSDGRYVYARSDINDFNYTYIGYCDTPLKAKKMCKTLQDVFEQKVKLARK